MTMNRRATFNCGQDSVDDSGNDGKSQHLVLSALVAPPDEWKEFSHEWYAALIAENPKPLRKDSRGKIRYKANYADNQSECFAGFSSREVDEKTDHLMEILTEWMYPGMRKVRYINLTAKNWR
jgi:hypothetical protein